VLEAAADAQLPLLERVKLCSIVSSNLDEFFAVRIAALRNRVASDVSRRSPDGRTPAQALKAMRERTIELHRAQDSLWLHDLRPALAAEGVRVCAVEDCSPHELRVLTKRFTREIEPLLTPIAVGAAAPFPYVPSLALNIGLITREAGERCFVRVNVPADLPRFIQADDVRVTVEDVLLHFLPRVVGGRIEACTVFRITRDAGLSVTSGADDQLEAVELQLSRRRFGAPVRLEVAAHAAPEIVAVLAQELEIESDQVYAASAPLALGSLLELTGLDRPELKDVPWEPVTQRPFAGASASELLARIRGRDILVHHPYDAFDTSVEAFIAAAQDPKVAALKATVYRTGNPSATLASLVEAAEAGKQALGLVELKARFEERRNIQWSRALERAGVDVVYGGPDLKVHAKLALLARHERSGVRRYVHIGTGNYHATNAAIFEDLSLFTADEEIAADVADVFNAVTGVGRPDVFRKLLVGPWFLREGILHEIDVVVRAARDGEPARIRLKVNALVDPEVVNALYAASSAGVAVEIVARGICVLRPGVQGLSDRISVRSVLGRFLEHSRIFVFQAGERTTTYIGSADLMPRNLDRRIEVLVPVEDSRLRTQIAAMLDALLADTRLAWQLTADGMWARVPQGSRPVSAQEALMARARKRSKKSR
jgi:polyphosphate kinase